MVENYLVELCRLLVMIVLASAAWSKILDINRFADSLVESFNIGKHLGKPLALVVTTLEWGAAALIFMGNKITMLGMVLALLLFTFFWLVMAEVVVRKRQAFCQCFGRSAHLISTLDLFRNGFYILACVVYIFGNAKQLDYSHLTHLILFLMAVLCFLVSISMNEIKQLIR